MAPAEYMAMTVDSVSKVSARDPVAQQCSLRVCQVAEMVQKISDLQQITVTGSSSFFQAEELGVFKMARGKGSKTFEQNYYTSK